MESRVGAAMIQTWLDIEIEREMSEEGRGRLTFELLLVLDEDVGYGRKRKEVRAV